LEQRRIISLGYPVGRVDESGDWIPRTQNPLTGQWEDIEPGEILDALLENGIRCGASDPAIEPTPAPP
jgi:hypothetical protein